ncbi:MAG: winged helix-turn-helix domain-containing protein [Candidatus Bathyarchaeia archaeon]|jgi:DNA-binding transcriptional ArsR family regulator
MVDAAELFEAISHPERIRILKILEKQPTSFASLKRQLGIDSSGNVDFHLKKLAELVAVREDGLYGLTAAGKEALLSIDAVEAWAEMERRKTKMFRKMPNEAFALGLLEICSSTALIFWFLLPQIQLPFIMDSLWGYIFFGALVLLGFRSGIGAFFHLSWSWTMTLAKSALIISMSLFLLDYIWTPGAVTQSGLVALSYLAFVAAEIAAVILALRPLLKDYLGIISRAKLPRRDLIGSLLCISGGMLLILLENAVRFHVLPNTLNLLMLPDHVGTVFASMADTSILCGLLMIAGGVLIPLRSSILGAVISIIFGLFPTPLSIIPWLPKQTTHHAFELIYGINQSLPYALIAAIVYALPIVGGLLALYSAWRKIRT